ncbi:MAG: phosphate ABC transporter substrate-binding/OmpA family protein [Geminicoccales bacterium]
MTYEFEKTYRALMTQLFSIGLQSLFVLLLTSVLWHQAEAKTRQHIISPERLSELADQLVDMIADKGVSESCRLHLIEIENVVGPLLAEGTLNALETSIDAALQDQFPGSGCDAGILNGYDEANEKEIAGRLADEGRSGFIYTLSFFPRSSGLMLLATAYRPDGRFAAFSNATDISTVMIDGDRQKTTVEKTTLDLAANRNETSRPVTKVLSPSAATFGSLAAIGTPAEIAAIKSRKLALMPDDPKPSSSPDIGLRIDIGNAVESTVIKDLARVFLAAQPGSRLSAPIIEEQNRLRLDSRTDGGLQGIELLDNDREVAFDQLFRGDVDLVVSSEPISQTDYDRFASAYGVDMRSGAGETVIGIDATGLIVHVSNRLSSMTKELAAKIFSGEVTGWDQDDVARSGLAGPIQVLAPAHDVGLYNGYTVRPDLILNASAEIADLVEINPLSLGIGNASVAEEDGRRILAIEECGIVYPTDDFFLRTEDHPLAHRLFLYSNPAKGNRFRNAFLFFATSAAGQDLIGRHAIDLNVALGGPERTRERIEIILSQPTELPDLKDDLIGLIDGAKRLSTTFRFRFDSPELRLDQHAARDLANLIRLSQRDKIDPRRLLLLGFADADGNADYNETLSLERAHAIAKRLRTYGLPVPEANIYGFGEEAPVACNSRPDGADDELGKARNRRVEIWLLDEVS